MAQKWTAAEDAELIETITRNVDEKQKAIEELYIKWGRKRTAASISQRWYLKLKPQIQEQHEPQTNDRTA